MRTSCVEPRVENCDLKGTAGLYIVYRYTSTVGSPHTLPRIAIALRHAGHSTVLRYALAIVSTDTEFTMNRSSRRVYVLALLVVIPRTIFLFYFLSFFFIEVETGVLLRYRKIVVTSANRTNHNELKYFIAAINVCNVK